MVVMSNRWSSNKGIVLIEIFFLHFCFGLANLLSAPLPSTRYVPFEGLRK